MSLSIKVRCFLLVLLAGIVGCSARDEPGVRTSVATIASMTSRSTTEGVSDLPGKLVFGGPRSGIWYFATGQSVLLGDNVLVLGVAPSRDKLAEVLWSSDPADRRLRVRSVDGRILSEVPFLSQWSTLGGQWLDEDRLALNYYVDIDQPPLIWPVAIMTADSGEWIELSSDYPGLTGMISGPAGSFHFQRATVVYSSSLDAVVYPKTEGSAHSIVLWDRVAGVAVAEVTDAEEFGHEPIWSPDQRTVIVAAAVDVPQDTGTPIEEWFSMSLAGEVEQLSGYANRFDTVILGAASWSPEGDRIAFWLRTKPSICSGWHLGVLSLQSRQTTEYCSGSQINNWRPPIWSPDGEFIAIDGGRTRAEPFGTIVVSMTDSAVPVEFDNGSPLGWLR